MDAFFLPMDTALLKTVGQIAGIGGLALGVFLILFREIIRKSIFPTLTKQHAYQLLRLISILVWTVALAGIGTWAWTGSSPDLVQETHGKNAPAIQGVDGPVTITIGEEDKPE